MPPVGWHPSPEQLQRLRDSHREQKPWNTGKHVLLNFCLLDWQKTYTPSQHYNWKGGITPSRFVLRNSVEMRTWRLEVFTRDEWTCQNCGEMRTTVNAHHILPFALFPEYMFDVDNGLTLCVRCHREFDTENRQIFGGLI